MSEEKITYRIERRVNSCGGPYWEDIGTTMLTREYAEAVFERKVTNHPLPPLPLRLLEVRTVKLIIAENYEK